MVVSKVAAYEGSRMKRLKEKKKRMEELNLNKIGQALSTPKSSPIRSLSAYTELYENITNGFCILRHTDEAGEAEDTLATSEPLRCEKVQSSC
ncbi:hypothetical protein Vadar_018436 [Vaccinium darrowii]|uniref:Uncharacterized protein n=1 Tax=Vaccinium darrowii TaxID=229202 RepID=A0ACB7ZJY7_9ERIC|nr:hypothetical protein Vadar_018436 [Vaccinium darrowii]